MVVTFDTALQVRQKAWDEQGANSKKWYTQPHPGQPRDKDDSKFEKDPPNSVHPEFVLVSSTFPLMVMAGAGRSLRNDMHHPPS